MDFIKQVSSFNKIFEARTGNCFDVGDFKEFKAGKLYPDSTQIIGVVFNNEVIERMFHDLFLVENKMPATETSVGNIKYSSTAIFDVKKLIKALELFKSEDKVILQMTTEGPIRICGQAFKAIIAPQLMSAISEESLREVYKVELNETENKTNKARRKK